MDGVGKTPEGEKTPFVRNDIENIEERAFITNIGAIASFGPKTVLEIPRELEDTARHTYAYNDRLSEAAYKVSMFGKKTFQI